MKVSYKKFSKFGRVPIRATSGSVCFDVYSSCEVSLRPGETKFIDLDIGLSFLKNIAAEFIQNLAFLCYQRF